MPAAKQERAAAEKRLLQLNERFNRRALSVLNDNQRAKLSLIEAKVLGATLVYAPGNQENAPVDRRTKAPGRSDSSTRGVAYVGKINRQFEEGKISHQQRLQLLRNRRIAQGAQIVRLLTAEQRNVVQALEVRQVPQLTPRAIGALGRPDLRPGPNFSEGCLEFAMRRDWAR